MYQFKWSDEGEGFMKWPWMTTRGRVFELTTWSGGLIFFVLDQEMAALILHLSSTIYMPNFWNMTPKYDKKIFKKIAWNGEGVVPVMTTWFYRGLAKWSCLTTKISKISKISKNLTTWCMDAPKGPMLMAKWMYLLFSIE